MPNGTDTMVATPGWAHLLMGRRPRRTLARLLLLVAVTFIVFRWILLPIRIYGPSMEPRYRQGQINCINRWAYLRHPPRRGDVVGIPYPQARALLLKRIVGLPGERLSFREGVVYINGASLAEPYVLLPRAPWRVAEIQLGPGEYYVVGDNRQMPESWHEKGMVELRQIAGRILF